MPAYEPFLLPHVEGYREKREPVTAGSPLDEETSLPALPGLWPALEKAVRRSCGLPLLTALPAGMKPRLAQAGRDSPSPRRFLLLEGSDATWFVLEHPSALHLFDRCQQGRQRPALARPSLFLEWYLQASTGDAAEPSSIVPESPPADPSVALRSFLLGLGAGRKVSDWHLEPVGNGYRSRVRIDGQLEPQPFISHEKGQWLIHSVIGAADLGNHPADDPVDGAFPIKGASCGEVGVRVSLVPSVRGLSMVLRFLRPSACGELELGGLGFLPWQVERLQEAFREPDGLWLVAGPTGAGKSTTLYALLREAAGRNEKILTAEDPVDTILPGVQQAQVNERRGISFTTLLRAFMRQAPDTLLIGEIRDEETAATTLQAANSGHRVLASIHAADTAGVIRRFTDLGQRPELVRSSCAAVIHQRLIRLVCGKCHSLREPTAAMREVFRSLPGPFPEQIPVAVGCPNCLGGYAGRTGIYAIGTGLEAGKPREDLLAPAWYHFCQQRTTLACLQPYLSRTARGKFTLCHV